MSTKLFVYGVNRSCPKDILEEKFSKFGAVSDVYITEKGYAFVTMDDANEADAAIAELNGTQLVQHILIFSNIFRPLLIRCFIRALWQGL